MTVVQDRPPAQRAPVEDTNRQVPQDIPAEQAVLGGVMLSKQACAEVLEIISGADFYRPAHQKIFDAIVRLYGRGDPVDAITVATELADTGDLMKVGGAPYIHTLVSMVPTAASAAYYARKVAERATQRRLIEAGMRIIQLGYRAGEDIARSMTEVATLAQQAVYEVTAREAAEGYSLLGDLLEPTLNEIEAIGNRGGELTGLPTGFIDLDRLLNGLHPGQLILVAARPSMGKSTLTTDIARHVSIHTNKSAAIFSLEMGKIELVMRILSAESRVPLHILRSGHLGDDEWMRLARCMGDIADAPLIIDDTPSLTLMQLRSKAQRLKQTHDIKLIVVDYIQLMSSPKRGASREREVAEISRGLKLLAKELEIPVIGVCQLNRGPEARHDKIPQLGDLRESGALEQDADVVILVHRDDYYDRESPRAGEADFIVAKNRNGPTDTITVAAQLDKCRFVDMAVPEGVVA